VGLAHEGAPSCSICADCWSFWIGAESGS
jgi:hypothetical protein